MDFSPEQVARLAELVRIDMTMEECEHFAPQLALITESVAVVSSVVDGSVAPTSHAYHLENVFRADEVAPSMPYQDALSGAPVQQDQMFRVPQILGEDL